MIAERVIVQLNHANSAVVLTAIKVLLYLMNYMDNRKIMEYICRKMGPPLGQCSTTGLLCQSISHMHMCSSDPAILGTGSAICCPAQYSSHHPEATSGAQE